MLTYADVRMLTDAVAGAASDAAQLPSERLRMLTYAQVCSRMLETYYLLLNVRSITQIVPRENAKFPRATTPWVVVSRSKLQSLLLLNLSSVTYTIHITKDCASIMLQNIHSHKSNDVRKHNWQHTKLCKVDIAIGSWYTSAKSLIMGALVSVYPCITCSWFSTINQEHAFLLWELLEPQTPLRQRQNLDCSYVNIKKLRLWTPLATLWTSSVSAVKGLDHQRHHKPNCLTRIISKPVEPLATWQV
jgi:hypothetical protein